MLLFWCLTLKVNAQFNGDIALGDWRSHNSFSEMRLVVPTPLGVYAASTTGLIFIDKATNSIQSLSKVTGLSDTRISAMAYDSIGKQLVVGYETGNIDFIADDGSVDNLNAILRRTLNSSKRINQITVSGNRAYLSCAFGLSVLNLRAKEVTASNLTLGQRLGGSTSISVINTVELGDSLYLSTSEGIKVIRKTSNVQNTANFFPIALSAQLPLPNANWSLKLGIWAGALFVAESPFQFDYRNVYRWVPGANEAVIVAFGRPMPTNFSSTPYGLTLGAIGGILRWTDSGFQFDTSGIKHPVVAIQDGPISYWVADYQLSFVRKIGSSGERIDVNGPSQLEPYRLRLVEDKILAFWGQVAQSDFAPGGTYLGYSEFSENSWKNHLPNRNGFPDVNDLVDADLDPRTGTIWFASYGSGLIEAKKDGTYTVYDERNSPIYNLLARPPRENQVRVTAVKVDNRGNLWLTNFQNVEGALLKRSPSGQWQQFNFNDAGINAIDLILLNNGDLWCRMPNDPGYRMRGPIWAANERGGNKMILSNPTQGNLPSEGVNDIETDADGTVYVGTDKGVAVFYNPASAIRNLTFGATWPIYNGRYLLEDESVTSIAVDGGGRKWFGTRNNGLWLFNKELNKIEAIFNTSNSPLPNNFVKDIVINGSSGEVFFATPDGIVSYRGNATTAESETSCGTVKVFPNPVRPDFKGPIAIEGLPANATVKITDAAGRLKFEGKAQGGTFTWDRKDYTGSVAKSGIYYALVSNEDGTGTCATKLAVIE